ncbi:MULTISPECIES: DUF397 domain-containing protein [Actinomadura]|uniref:DUF397 domain-containing protein n=1 Tax=Actinomadura yumaensis TaxID=111807 RepID=A0ABW2CJR9_9ACTN|nr:DUF397 domain-containing protein [Actinomadura sp. J1-007]MWK33033.1 DUF397 domain-containing protein [Actinomadura sp. J1-007]
MTSPVWRKSTRSSQGTSGECVEVAEVSTGVGLRDSKDPDGARLVVSRRTFAAFLVAVKRR